MKTITTNYFTFEELSTEKQTEVLKRYWDILVDPFWFYGCIEQCNELLNDIFGQTSKNIYFSCDRENFCSFELSMSYKTFIEIIKSDVIKEKAPHLFEYLEPNINKLKNEYLFKREKIFNVIYNNLYRTTIDCQHARSSLDITLNESLSYIKDYPNIEEQINLFFGEIREFFEALSTYFLQIFKDEMDYKYSNEAIKTHFIEYETHFNEHNLDILYDVENEE